MNETLAFETNCCVIAIVTLIVTVKCSSCRIEPIKVWLGKGLKGLSLNFGSLSIRSLPRNTACFLNAQYRHKTYQKLRILDGYHLNSRSSENYLYR